MNYERQLKNSREDIVKKYEKDYNDIIQEYKLQLWEQSKAFNIEREAIVVQVENRYKEIIKNLKVQFDKEKTDMTIAQLKMTEDIQNLCKKKITDVENQFAAVKQNFLNDVEVFTFKLEKKDKEIENLRLELNETREELYKAEKNISLLKVEVKKLEKENVNSIESKKELLASREMELLRVFEADKKNLLSRAYSERLELETRMEKTIHVLNERYDTLSMKFKLLESKKREMYQKDYQQTMQRLAQELADKNKNIDSLNKDIGRLKVQLKYTDNTVRIFTTEKSVSATHKKSGSELSAIYNRRPSSVGLNKTFKF